MTESVHDEIKKDQIIKASSIYGKFDALFQPLLTKAQSNCTELQTKINALSSSGQSISNFYTFEKTQLERILGELKNLEENWKDVDEAWEGEGNCPLSRTRPLHIEKRNVIPASGKVRKFDYIAAYNFKGFLQALYGIAAELRNIAFRVYEDGEYKTNYSVGHRTRFESYKDLDLLDQVTDHSIPLSETDSKIFNFQDYIINNNTNGDVISVQNDEPTRKTPHGFSNENNNLIPTNIIEMVSKSQYINTNVDEINSKLYEFGRQTTNHLQKEGVPNTSPSSKLENYYNVPSRTASYNRETYQANPTTGVAKEFLTLKPAGSYDNDYNLVFNSFSEVSTDISNYLYVQGPNDNDKILSTPQKYTGTEPEKRQIIKADTVNNLYREMNSLFVKISASLCGEYKFEYSNSTIPIYNSPKGGLGYPEVLSWYFSEWTSSKGDEITKYLRSSSSVDDGTIVEGNNNTYPTENSIYSKGSASSLRKVRGILNNGKLIAREEITESKPTIRTGMFWLGYDNIDYADNYKKKLSLDELKSTIVYNAYTSVVPMSYNNRLIRESSTHAPGIQPTDPNFWASIRMSNDATGWASSTTMPSTDYKAWTYSQKAGFLPFTNNTLELSCCAYKSPNTQLFNRNCISNPLEISSYLYDSLESQLTEMSSLNVNTKYIYMPSLSWLNYLARNGITNSIYNGKIPRYNSSTFDRTVISTGNNYLNPAAGIPVIYDTRENVWNHKAIIKSPRDFNAIGTNDSEIPSLHYGTVQLLLNKNRSNERDYLPTYTNYKINWLEYALKCGISINEVNDTHFSKANTSLSIYENGTNKHITHVISTNYYLHKDGNGFPPSSNDGQATYYAATAADGAISSYIFNGFNNYSVKDYWANPVVRSEISNYMRSGLMDMMEILYGSRFKFNDFYDTGNPLSTGGMKVSDIEAFFAAGGSNRYAEGNATKCISWVTRLTPNVMNPGFYVLHSIYQKHDGDDPKPKDKPALAAGNFFIGGNQSNAINCHVGENDDRTYFYYIAPQPDPISATSVSMNPETQKFVFTGKCSNFWNDISSIRVNLHSVNGAPVSFSIRNANTFPQLENNRPYRNVYPSTSGSLAYAGNEVATYSYISSNKYYNINIELPIPENMFASELSCTMRFYNENKGFRDVCKSKNNADINSGAFKIYEPVTCKVTFDAGGGDGGSMDSVDVVQNMMYTLPPCGFTKTDYHFTNWKVGSTYKDAGTRVKITAATTITAQWEADPVPTE